MRNHLLIIDPQNDFCDIEGAALPVRGANADLQRLAALINTHQERIDHITVTLDSHASVAVERTTFWCDAAGAPLAPFSYVTLEQVQQGQVQPRNPALKDSVEHMLQALQARGKPGMVVWPVHCVTGTWGHNLHNELAGALAGWELHHQRAVTKVLKGEYPLSEHFGVFEADAPRVDVPSTQFNTALATRLVNSADRVIIAGQASSHCVAASYDQFMRFLAQQQGPRPDMVLLHDCMSPVPGFERDAEALFEQAQAAGTRVLSSQELAQALA